MKQIAYSILAFWCLSLSLNLSPIHSFANKPNYLYSLLILLIVLGGTSIVARTKINYYPQSITYSRILRRAATANSILLILVTVYVTLALLTSSEFSLSSNRAAFESNHSYYNYIFILTIPFVILNALSSFSSTLLRRTSIVAWLGCTILLLFSGNRQFFFFSVTFLFFYSLGKSPTPKILYKKLLVVTTAIFLFIVFFSILRLDYLGDLEVNTVAKYMSSLTGASCTGGINYCDSFAETVFQLVYAYLGMNHSGLAYSLDFYYRHGGLPAFLSTFPLLYRRFESAFLLNSYSEEQNYDSFVAGQAGDEYSHFFSTMFGAFGIEFGWIGVVTCASVILFATWYFSIKCESKKSTDLDYCLYILTLTAYVFGIMQSPTTEPFYALIIINWTLLSILNAAVKK